MFEVQSQNATGRALGFVPIVISGLASHFVPSGHGLWLRAQGALTFTLLSQGTGNEFWQTNFHSGSYEIVYNMEIRNSSTIVAFGSSPDTWSLSPPPPSPVTPPPPPSPPLPPAPLEGYLPPPPLPPPLPPSPSSPPLSPSPPPPSPSPPPPSPSPPSPPPPPSPPSPPPPQTAPGSVSLTLVVFQLTAQGTVQDFQP